MLNKDICKKIFEKNVDGIILVDKKGVVRFANPAADALFGASLQGQEFGYPIITGESTEVDIIHNGHPKRIAELRAVEFDNGKKEHILISLRDLTERIHMEQALRHAKETAEQAVLAKERFLSNLSHELRTPLNAVIGFSGLLLDGCMGDLNKEQKEYLRDVLNSGRDLLYVVNNLLDLADAETHNLSARLSRFKLNQFLHNRLTTVQDQVQEKGIQLTSQCVNAPEYVCSDEQLLGNIMNQLLLNAIKFTPTNGRIQLLARTVTDDQHMPKGFLLISITDNGCGIQSENLERVFQPFEQEDGSSRRLFGGLGVGLTLAKKSTLLLGGHLWVESAGKQQGSRFHVAIPITCQHAS